MNKKICLFLLLTLFFTIGSYAESISPHKAYIKYDNLYVYLDQYMEDIWKYFEIREKKIFEKPEGIYIKETFKEGLTVFYYKDVGKVDYMISKTDKAISVLGIGVSDSREKLLSRSEEFRISGNFIVYTVYIADNSLGPFSASISHIIKDDFIDEIHIGFDLN